ncbi:toprim domain-containing protein [Legionella sp. km772]|uniref:DUF7146 domain-containing protein n=1 Tax=Legionella sp. km772 TaxID=2498111 RepID=UPI000F8D60C1|nr:toprim domain-containing protein [Legionella sp. km772]RUR13505.1 hypothetical protein ELY15_02035 [Legionella sp. km772]
MINFQTVNQVLLARLEHHARTWVPHGKVVGGNYIALNPRRNDQSLGSFCLNLQKGFWVDYATGDRGGDPVSYFAYINALSQSEAGKILSTSTGTTVTYQIPTVFKAPKVNTKSQNPYCQQIWREAQSANGTLVEDYLHGRGFNLTVPKTLRFHPSLYHAPSKQFFPCMVGAILKWPDQKLMGIHRTYLDPITAKKASADINKMMLGKASGGAVRLSPLSELLIIAEGIESALSVLQVQPNATVWAALSAGGIKNLCLPDETTVKTIIIAADHDPTGIKAAIQAANLWVLMGRKVKIALPPKACDFNDVLMGVAS